MLVWKYSVVSFKMKFDYELSDSILLVSYAQIYSHKSRRRPDVFCKKVFLEISQNSQENTRARVYF